MCIDIDVHFHCPTCHHLVDRLTYRRARDVNDPGPEYKKHICRNNTDVEGQAPLCDKYHGRFSGKGICREPCDECLPVPERWKRVEKRRGGWVPEERLESRINDRFWIEEHLDHWINQAGQYTDPLLSRPGPQQWRRLHPPRYASWTPGYRPPQNVQRRRDIDAGHFGGPDVQIVVVPDEHEQTSETDSAEDTLPQRRRTVGEGTILSPEQTRAECGLSRSSSREPLLRRSYSS